MKPHVISTALALGLLAAPLFGQGLTIPRGQTEAQIKAAAEHEGAAFAKKKGDAGDAQPRVCVSTYELGPATSGEFTIGGRLSGGRALHAGAPGKVWWAPLHSAPDMPPLLVRGRSLTNPRDTVRYTQPDVARPPLQAGLSAPAIQAKYFFPSGITIPSPGRWLVVATSGQNWGCFILTVV